MWHLYICVYYIFDTAVQLPVLVPICVYYYSIAAMNSHFCTHLLGFIRQWFLTFSTTSASAAMHPKDGDPRSHPYQSASRAVLKWLQKCCLQVTLLRNTLNVAMSLNTWSCVLCATSPPSLPALPVCLYTCCDKVFTNAFLCVKCVLISFYWGVEACIVDTGPLNVKVQCSRFKELTNFSLSWELQAATPVTFGLSHTLWLRR